MPDAGVFIAVEGIDGAGKTTQVEMLRDALKEVGQDVITSKEPTNGTWGKLLRESATNGRLRLEEELEYFLKDREEHLETTLFPALNAGKIVIVDRFFYSTIAYQGARGGGDLKILDNIVRKRAKRLPDVVVVLDLDPTLALYRIATRDGKPNEFERLDNLRKVRTVFKELCQLEGERLFELDGSMSRGAIHRTVVNIVIDHALKAHRCTKSYGCDDPVHCTFRIQGTCEWVNLRTALRANLPEAHDDEAALLSG